MKIVQIMATSGGGVGGLEQHTFNLVNALANEHEVHLIALPNYADKLNANVYFHAFDFSRSRLNPLMWWQLLQQIKAIDPDIVHAQAGKAAELVKRIRRYLPHKTKVVTTVHGTKKNKAIYAHADAVIAVSQALTAGLPKNKTHVIYNGIHLKVPKVDRYLMREKIHAIAVGRLVEVKGFVQLIEAWQGVDANLSIIGDGPQLKVLSEKIEQLGLEDNVQLLGQRHDVLQLLEQSDCLIISSFKEGGPITLAEALLTQTPVLSTEVGMVSAFLPTSYICKNNDPDCLRALLQDKLADRLTMQSQLQSAFDQAQQHLNFEKMLSKTQALYLQLKHMN